MNKVEPLFKSNVTYDSSNVSVKSSYPAFHLKSHCGDMVAESMMIGREFAHMHTKYFHDTDPVAIEANAQGKRWQEYQGCGLGSMHATFSLQDAATIIDNGWGESHLLAGAQINGKNLARGLLLVYAPRTIEEVDVVYEILNASYQFAISK